MAALIRRFTRTANNAAQEQMFPGLALLLVKEAGLVGLNTASSNEVKESVLNWPELMPVTPQFSWPIA